MVEISSELLAQTLSRACESFASGELAYLALTSKPEHPIRDRMAWSLYEDLAGCVTAREWSAHGNRDRTDLAVLDAESHEALALVELKAAYTFDFMSESQPSVNNYVRRIAGDLDKARFAADRRTRVFGLLLLTHPTSVPVQRTSVVKYGPSIARSLQRRSAADLAEAARQIAGNRLAAMGTVTGGTIAAGTAFGIGVDIEYFFVAPE
ncbi:hypothetical protein [Streptomyces sparsus]